MGWFKETPDAAQWQAQPLPQPPADADGAPPPDGGEAAGSEGLASDLVSVLASAPVVAGAAAEALPAPLKSVAYQPEPFN